MKKIKFLAAVCCMLAVFTACENDTKSKIEELENRIEGLENGGNSDTGNDTDQNGGNSNTGSDNATGTANGHGYVDLGLPSGLKWATCNVGASAPEEYGDYYAWGETSTKSSYDTDNSKTYGKSMGNIGGNSSYDVVRYRWGGSWRMPTKAELEELKTKCTWTWTTQGGHNGYKVTSKTNGKSIFLPTAGWRDGASPIYVGESGYYWSSSPHESNTRSAYSLYFYSSGHDVDWYRRSLGFSVRPVV